MVGCRIIEEELSNYYRRIIGHEEMWGDILKKNEVIPSTKERYLGCMIGGAIGDNMGLVIEGLDESEIIDYFGTDGITKPFFNEEFGKCLISDDTQMALFTADGLEWAHIRMTSRGIGSYAASGVWQSYARWYYTQTGIVLDDYIMHKHEHEPVALSSIGIKTVLEYEEFYSNRNVSEESLLALESGQMGTVEMPLNDFKDWSCLARVAPVGLFLHEDPSEAFAVAMEIAAITHGHPSAYLAAGAYAYILAQIVNGKEPSVAVREMLGELKKYSYVDEVNDGLEYALHLSECDYDWKYSISMLGEGVSAEDVLSIGVYCALKAESYEEAVYMAANSVGMTSSCAFIAGSIAGAYAGENVISADWKHDLELYKMMVSWMDKLYKLKEI